MVRDVLEPEGLGAEARMGALQAGLGPNRRVMGFVYQRRQDGGSALGGYHHAKWLG